MRKDLQSLHDLANEIQPEHVGHMPVIAHLCDCINIAEIVNDCLPSKSFIDQGTNVVAMILDTLSGRSPLYQVEDFFKNQDTELLLGRDIPAEAFNDDSLGRTLDKIHEYGTLKLFSNISLNAAEIYNLQSSQGSFDTTSVNLWGNYENSENNQPSPHITYGHSKDKRPDLKQFMVSMLCIEGNIPISGKMQDGNSSDNKLNNEELERLSSLLKPLQQQPEDFIYVADCKLVTSSNLSLLTNSKFISRLPASYTEHDKAIQRALEANDWTTLGVLAETPTNSTKRTRSSYRSHETSVKIDETNYRAIVIQTDELDERKTKAINRQREKELTQVNKEIKKLEKEQYHCVEDAEKHLTKHTKIRAKKYWNITGKVTVKPIYAGGRVAKGGTRRIVRESFSLSLEATPNDLYHEGKLLRAGCFVMLTNLTEEAKSSKEILKIYKEQYGIEQNFSFLKEPLIVNDTFLKTPGRIDALVMILLLSLLIWNLIQHLLRKSDECKNGQLHDLNKRPTKRPTSYLFISQIKHTLILKRGNERCLPRNGLSEQGKNYLFALGLDESIFTKPPKSSTSRYYEQNP